MTVNSTTIQTSMGDMLGRPGQTTITSDVANEGHFISDADLTFDGPTAKDGKTGAVKAIINPADLAPEDRIVIDGLEMTVRQARDMGFAIKVDAPKGSSSEGSGIREVTPQANGQAKPTEVDVDPNSNTTDSELVIGETMIAAVQHHAGLSQAETEELGADIALGEIGRDDQVWTALNERGIPREAALDMVSRSKSIVQREAQRELGHDDYGTLQALANGSKAVRQLITQHALKRLNGTAQLSWKQVLGLCQQHAAR